MSGLQYIIYSIILVLLIEVGLLLLAVFSGRTSPAFTTLQPEDQVVVNGSQLSVADLAARYKPEMFVRKTTPTPPLLWVWYQAVPEADAVVLLYYHVWENEINPNPVVHHLYSLFRAAYYGYPLYDIEYLQVRVSKATGAVSDIRFETSPGNDYWVVYSEHKIVRYQVQPNGLYDEISISKAGDELGRVPGLKVNFDNQRATVGAYTWNHLTTLVNNPGVEYSERLDAPLKPLSVQEYADYKFVRKSQGDYHTDENSLTRYLSYASIVLIVVVPMLPFILAGWLRASRKRSVKV